MKRAPLPPALCGADGRANVNNVSVGGGSGGGGGGSRVMSPPGGGNVHLKAGASVPSAGPDSDVGVFGLKPAMRRTRSRSLGPTEVCWLA